MVWGWGRRIAGLRGGGAPLVASWNRADEDAAVGGTRVACWGSMLTRMHALGLQTQTYSKPSSMGGGEGRFALLAAHRGNDRVRAVGGSRSVRGSLEERGGSRTRCETSGSRETNWSHESGHSWGRREFVLGVAKVDAETRIAGGDWDVR